MIEIILKDVPVGIEEEYRLTHAFVKKLLNYTGQAPESILDCTDSGGLTGNWCLVIYTTGEKFRLPVHARQVVAAIKNFCYIDSKAYTKTVDALCHRKRNVPVHLGESYTLMPFKSIMCYSNPHFQSYINYYQIDNRTKLSDRFFVTPEGHRYLYGCRERAIRLKMIVVDDVERSLRAAMMVFHIPLNVNDILP